ncbi:MAG: hypothetical protein K2F83_02110 [Oscillospiraceae bacterium]|nr:hypothetical protein [Oscillospiraceae bacterium]
MFGKKKNLFQENMDPRCAYCAKGSFLDDEQILCAKKGVVPASGHCRAFRYDPLRRVPPKPAVLKPDTHSPEEFRLD